MISRETLEELWFKKAMEEFARRRGEQYERENEELIQDPNSAVPEELRQRNLQLIEESFNPFKQPDSDK